ncbi:MAG: adenylyltransferase/cytidyltransferase family protein [Kiritimatiellia bacterium]|nr:adenylyltransferase/cytidyltransferase family protein [Kiritimatiellia bacterium]MDP6629930.1 adenylyltransferase/cytidyltransferase family protein [Kiritimatiellia bacterium]MDP6810128.1 adenylyltransferase/cytidyltransferase family protein [Kiritimatiellia bacterium]MDP7023654.1 adenylyltransferase/cytidyltransferase family protein [Kiritimatiellia bacterium]
MRDPKTKIVSREGIVALRAEWKAAGQRVAFTNGCFDLLHAGHAGYLAFARQQGDLLVVGLNSDRSVRELKGKNRPIVDEEERALLVASLEAVDYVVIFDELHVENLIKELLPDVLIKGGDRADWVCGREIVESNGGGVILAPEVEGRSSTGIIDRVRGLEA